MMATLFDNFFEIPINRYFSQIGTRVEFLLMFGFPWPQKEKTRPKRRTITVIIQPVYRGPVRVLVAIIYRCIQNVQLPYILHPQQ